MDIVDWLLGSWHGWPNPNDAGSFAQIEEFRQWAADKPPEFNAFAFAAMVREREHATRLEF